MSARRVLPDEARRGWCPSLARPMPTGDGLLARVHPRLGILGVDQLWTVAEGARHFGNGHVDVTARANLQIRGVRTETAPGLAALLAEAGLGDVRNDGGPQRLTLTSPLAGLDPLEPIDVPALARAIEAEGLRIAALPAKTLVAIAGVGVSVVGADIVVQPISGRGLTISLAGISDDAVQVAESGAVNVIAAMLLAFAATGRRRMRDLSAEEHADVLHAGIAAARRHPPPPSAGEDGPRVSEGRERGKPSPERAVPAPLPPAPQAPSPAEGGRFARVMPTVDLPAGLAEMGTLTILVVEAPFGRCTADALDHLADAAQAVASPEIRVTPGRGFALACESRDTGIIALETLATAGFVTRPDDPRRAVAACPGAPACASGTTPVPDHAARLARAFAPFATRGLTAHVSGCAKGCAHPESADLTLVGEDGRYRIVVDGAPSAASAMRLTFEAALERVRRADTAEPLLRAFRTSA